MKETAGQRLKGKATVIRRRRFTTQAEAETGGSVPACSRHGDSGHRAAQREVGDSAATVLLLVVLLTPIISR